MAGEWCFGTLLVTRWPRGEGECSTYVPTAAYNLQIWLSGFKWIVKRRYHEGIPPLCISQSGRIDNPDFEGKERCLIKYNIWPVASFQRNW